jgi:hypothetical protein
VIKSIKMLSHIERVFSQILLHKSRRIQSKVLLPFAHVLAGEEGMYNIKFGYIVSKISNMKRTILLHPYCCRTYQIYYFSDEF